MYLKHGVDLSSHNGKMINFEKLKEGGYSFVIFRSSIGLIKDSVFEENVNKCKKAGLDFGCYHYLKSNTVDGALQEAEFFYNTIKSYEPTYPVYLDFEDEPLFRITLADKIKVATVFLSYLEERKYYVGIYASLSVLMDLNLSDRYSIWCACWKNYVPDPIEVPISSPMWQYTVVGNLGTLGKDYRVSGTVPGVSGNCDVNYCYIDFPTIIKKNGLNSQVLTKDYKKLYEESQANLDKIKREKDQLIAEIYKLCDKYS